MFKNIISILQNKEETKTIVTNRDENDNTIVTQASLDTKTTAHVPSFGRVEWNYLYGYNKLIEAKFSWKSYESIDTFVFLLGKDNKIIKDSDLVFYNSETRRDIDGLRPFDKEAYRNKNYWREQTYPCSKNGAVWIDSNGFDEYEDDEECYETAHINLNDVENDIESIVFAHVVYSSPCNPIVAFGKDINFKIYICDQDGSGLVNACCENLDNKSILLSCKLRRKDDGWRFELINENINGPVQNLIDMYVE